MVKILIFFLLALMVYYSIYYFPDLYRHRKEKDGNFAIGAVIGLITDFLDTLGIGSYAPTTLLLDFTHQLDNDRKLPGTLNVAHSIPCIIEGIIFMTVVKVSPVTLFSMVIAAIIGSWVGSKTVTKLSEQKVQFYVGIALIITAVLMVARQMGWLDVLGVGNTATALTGIKLVIGVVGNFILGMLMTIGVGLYAPCMAMVYMLGLSPLVAFPIMMGSCAGLMPVASVNFIKTGDYARQVSFGITIGGLVGVFIAAKFVTNMNLSVLTWIIIVIVLYTGASYIVKSRKTAKANASK